MIATHAPDNEPHTSANSVSAGASSMQARNLGTTSWRIGSDPITLRASICSVTFMVPNSAVSAPPTRPASITYDGTISVVVNNSSAVSAGTCSSTANSNRMIVSIAYASRDLYMYSMTVPTSALGYGSSIPIQFRVRNQGADASGNFPSF